MIEMISTLIDKGHAYVKNGTVYFKTRSFKEYGKLSKKNLDDLEAGVRIAVSEDKEDPMDFVLWKPKKEGEPFWTSPWSEGRPGWHIECSVMSKKYLGEQIDIHAGGEDLVFPHHENEIAQSEACNGKEFARYWMHNNFLNIDNKKMSKSSGKLFTVREIGELYPLQVLRFFMLNAHYRSSINFSEELMASSKNSLDRILTAVYNLDHLLEIAEEKAMSEEEVAVIAELNLLKKKYEEAMEDDFNTADAIAAIFEIVKAINTQANAESSKTFLITAAELIVNLCGVLGLNARIKVELLDEEIEQLIKDRQEARKNKDFAKSDEIRDTLLKKGILLEDTREGVRWKRA